MFVLVVRLDYQSLFSGTGPRKRRKSSLVGWPHEKTYYEKLHGQLIPILYFADPVCWPSKWFNDQGLISVSNYISPKMWLKMCRLQLTWTFLTGEFFNVSALLDSKDLAKWQIDFAEGTNSALKQVLLYKYLIGLRIEECKLLFLETVVYSGRRKWRGQCSH